MGCSNKDAIVEIYAQRAKNYDENERTSSFHTILGKDFVKWSTADKGDKVLDLACGTGLVSFPLAEAAGPQGIVIGVDITVEMLDIGRAKLQHMPNDVLAGRARVELLEGDIASNTLRDLPSIRSVLDEGGFDIITCCSALILLPDPASTIQLWSSMLRKGGCMVIDVPTEHRNLQYLLTDTLWEQLGMSKDFDRTWVKGKHTLQDAYARAGLEISQSWETESVTPIRWFEGDEEAGLRTFDREILNYQQYQNESVRERARALWPQIWKSVLDDDGKYSDYHSLYVCVGKKL